MTAGKLEKPSDETRFIVVLKSIEACTDTNNVAPIFCNIFPGRCVCRLRGSRPLLVYKLNICDCTNMGKTLRSCQSEQKTENTQARSRNRLKMTMDSTGLKQPSSRLIHSKEIQGAIHCRKRVKHTLENLKRVAFDVTNVEIIGHSPYESGVSDAETIRLYHGEIWYTVRRLRFGL
jgi:hypothetical protein